MFKDEKTIGAGLTFLVLGIALVAYALGTLELGTARRMGPAYFPVMIGGMLALIGICTLTQAKGESRIGFRSWPWREILLVMAAILIFAVGLSTIGFLLSTVLMTFIAAIAERRTGWLRAAMISLAITLFCTAVFYWGLGIPFKLY